MSRRHQALLGLAHPQASLQQAMRSINRPGRASLQQQVYCDCEHSNVSPAPL